MPATEQPYRVRAATTDDRSAIAAVVAAAFGADGRDPREEVDIVAATWAVTEPTSRLELVALDGTDVVGHVLAAPGTFSDGGRALGIAPLSVHPDHQRRGVGSSLIGELLPLAERAGWSLAVLLGNPTYYVRFGFEPAASLGISYGPAGPDNPHFQVHRLRQREIETPRGVFTYCWES